jgi:hypothetical protein
VVAELFCEKPLLASLSPGLSVALCKNRETFSYLSLSFHQPLRHRDLWPQQYERL